MSANNIVIIKKEDDGRFRGYHRDYDAHCEGRYEEGLCPRCYGKYSTYNKCDGKGNYTPLKEDFIFEADTISEAICVYNEWCQELGFCIEYGFQFEGLEPNTETIQAHEESEAYILIKDNLKFIVNSIRNTNEGYVLTNCTPGMINERVQEILDNLNKISNVKIFDSAEALVEDLDRPSDTELLDFLQDITDKAEYAGKVICRKSTTGRGWRLHETSRDNAVPDVRQAIINYMKQVEGENGQPTQ